MALTELPVHEPARADAAVARKISQPAARTLGLHFRTAVDLTTEAEPDAAVLTPLHQPNYDALAAGTMVVYDVERYAAGHVELNHVATELLSTRSAEDRARSRYDLETSTADFLLRRPKQGDSTTFQSFRTAVIEGNHPASVTQEYVRQAGAGVVLPLKGRHRLVAPVYLNKYPEKEYGSDRWQAIGPLGRLPVGQTVLLAHKRLIRYERIRGMWSFHPSAVDFQHFSESMPAPPTFWQEALSAIARSSAAFTGIPPSVN